VVWGLAYWLQVSVRVMELDKFMNSKRLFKHVRNLPKDQRPPKPVTVHINYHPGMCCMLVCC
jgi:hypothetical protein